MSPIKRYKNRDPKLETGGKIIGFYEREYYCFSNFSSFAVRWKGKLWPTSEHAYQASRFFGTAPKIVEAIFRARSADDSYRLAKRYKGKLFADYRGRDLLVMEDIVRKKLHQHPFIQKKLFQTGKRKIVEDSPKDSFWGWGPDRKGRNELGKIWMKLRSELREKM